ncbi:sulfur carrier protein ThiS [Halonatronum saccharophilum]|uniref:sulfur carrier protein ThiS n=1 Tax=Halonatronum saccharophilum TaxID=150060 RepID=UPI00047F6238|nr:sulfur carrier protein ThiS [Halonatronum saccharophilum]
MKITVNGKEEILEEEITIKEYLLGKSMELERLVVEYNYNVLESEEWDNITLKAGDNLEVLKFVGGGC